MIIWTVPVKWSGELQGTADNLSLTFVVSWQGNVGKLITMHNKTCSKLAYNLFLTLLRFLACRRTIRLETWYPQTSIDDEPGQYCGKMRGREYCSNTLNEWSQALPMAIPFPFLHIHPLRSLSSHNIFRVYELKTKSSTYTCKFWCKSYIACYSTLRNSKTHSNPAL